MKTYKTTISEYQLKKVSTDIQKQKITSSKDAAAYIRAFYSDDISIYESFFILLLNRAHNTIGYAKISQGGICGTVVDTSIVMKYVIDSLAKGVILCHNHPSGNKQPSEADKRVCKNIKEVCSLMDVTVIDNIILTEDSYLSFADEGLL